MPGPKANRTTRFNPQVQRQAKRKSNSMSLQFGYFLECFHTPQQPSYTRSKEAGIRADQNNAGVYGAVTRVGRLIGRAAILFRSGDRGKEHRSSDAGPISE